MDNQLTRQDLMDLMLAIAEMHDAYIVFHGAVIGVVAAVVFFILVECKPNFSKKDSGE